MTARCLFIALTVFLTSAFDGTQGKPPQVSRISRDVRPGEVLMLTVEAASGPVTVRAFNKDWAAYAVDRGRWRALVGIDLETKPGHYTAAIRAGSEAIEYPVDVLRHAFPTRRLTVDPDLVNPPPDAQERIARENAELHQIWTHPAPQRLWSGAFIRPVPDPANSAFGTRSILNGEARSPHGGADFLSPAGRPVKAPNAGRVALAQSLYFTGNTVILDHGMGLFSLFAHLSKMNVAAGQTVATGDVVGEVGATGRVTGPHLHWTVRLNDARVDPLSLLYVLGGIH